MAELDDFLKGGTPPEEAPAPAAVESPPPEPAKQDDKPADTDDEPDLAPRDGEALIPRRAFEAIRHERQDWKAKAIRAETEREELRKQLEAASKAREPEPERAPPRPLDPSQDPQGFVAEIERRQINHHLNVSEMMMRKEIGDEAVDALVSEFRGLAKSDPSLSAKLYAQPHPFEFARKYVETAKMQREIGDDPSAYKARLRAEWEAEQASTAPAPRVSPAAGMAPSLATARSVAARSAPAFSGPPPLEDIVASIRRR
jgi:hypothetical protein